MTNEERKVIELALEALETPWNAPYVDGCDLALGKRVKAITAIKEALAQPEQEPVAYCWKSLSTGDLFDFVENKNGDALKEQDEDFPTSNLVLLYTTPPQRKEPEQDYPKDFIHALAFHTALSDLEPEQEPVAHFGSAYVNENGVHVTTVLGPVAIPQDAKLYTTPPQRQPLTLVELSHIFASIPSIPFDGEWQLELSRAIEAAHGIKE